MDEIISSRAEDTYCFLYSPCMPFSSNGVCCAHIYLILEKPRALSCPIKYLFPFQFHFPRFIRIWQMIVTFAVILSREKRKISIPLQISHHPFTPRNFNRFRSKIFSNPIWISEKSTRSKNCNEYLSPLIPSINCRFISNPTRLSPSTRKLKTSSWQLQFLEKLIQARVYSYVQWKKCCSLRVVVHIYTNVYSLEAEIMSGFVRNVSWGETIGAIQSNFWAVELCFNLKIPTTEKQYFPPSNRHFYLSSSLDNCSRANRVHTFSIPCPPCFETIPPLIRFEKLSVRIISLSQVNILWKKKKKKNGIIIIIIIIMKIILYRICISKFYTWKLQRSITVHKSVLNIKPKSVNNGSFKY